MDTAALCRNAAVRWALLSVLLASVAVVAWFYFAPSSLLKILLHPPRVERIEMIGSAVDGTVIDLGGGWFNEGKPTELVIRSRRTPDGWDVPQNITIRNARLRGSIRIQGFGRNGEAAREVIAVDGSARNLIAGNRFESADFGGIYLYRNCGEGGTVRHQTPRDNRIERNAFNLSGLRPGSYGVWIGSRQGHRSYCEADAGYDFGSSADNRDFADDNIVTGNIFDPPSSRAIRDDGAQNKITGIQ
jgi:parallel beta-helix repeat protein